MTVFLVIVFPFFGCFERLISVFIENRLAAKSGASATSVNILLVRPCYDVLLIDVAGKRGQCWKKIVRENVDARKRPMGLKGAAGGSVLTEFMSDTDKKILIFTATYNERDNILLLLENIWQFAPKADILVIDDNSPDGTGQVLDEAARANPKLIVQHRPGKMGVGSAHKEAIAYARNKSYDALITMDADFSHDPAVIPQMLKALDQYDYIVGSRFIEGGKIDYVGFRKLISVGANILARGGLGITCRETTTSYRCFSRELLAKLPIDQVKADGYSFFLECTYIICRTTKKILEVPIHFQDRRFGQSKISKNEIYRGFLTLIRLTLRRFLGLSRLPK